MASFTLKSFPFTPRNWATHFYIAAAIGLAGFIVSLAITLSGSYAARFVPPPGVFHTAALFGALVAGVVFASLFGKRGWFGVGLSLMAGGLMTALGAEIGALLAGCTGSASLCLEPGFGLLTLGFSLSEPLIIATWLSAMALVHVLARYLRLRPIHAGGDVA